MCIGKQKTSSCPGPNRDAGMGNNIFCRSDTQNENFAKGSGRGQNKKPHGVQGDLRINAEIRNKKLHWIWSSN